MFGTLKNNLIAILNAIRGSASYDRAPTLAQSDYDQMRRVMLR